jgi:hypothetical protein
MASGRIRAAADCSGAVGTCCEIGAGAVTGGGAPAAIAAERESATLKIDPEFLEQRAFKSVSLLLHHVGGEGLYRFG